MIPKLVVLVCDNCKIVAEPQGGDVICTQCGLPMKKAEFIRESVVIYLLATGKFKGENNAKRSFFTRLF